MNCRKCGNILHESSTSCPFCGEIVAQRKNIKESTSKTPQPAATEVLDENIKPPLMPPNNNDNKIRQYDTNHQKEKKSPFPFIIIILIIAFLITGAFLGYKYISKDSKNDTINQSEENEQLPAIDLENDAIEDNKEDLLEPDIEEKTNYFQINDYKFTIPSNLEYECNYEDYTLILFDTNNFRTAISFDVGDYETYEFDSQETIKDLEETGYTITNNSTKIINGIEYYLYEGTYESSPILAFTYKLDNNIILIGAIVSNDTTSFDNVLEIISDMINGVEKTNSNNEEETKNDTSSDLLPDNESDEI